MGDADSAAAAADADGECGTPGPAFHLFTRLPPELRLSIWQHFYAMTAMPDFHPYRVRAYMGRNKAHKSVVKLVALAELRMVTRASRDMLRICRESRYEHLKQVPDELQLMSGGLVRFDARRDVIYLDIIDARVIDRIVDSRDGPPEEAPAFARSIRHVGFEMMAVVPRWSRSSHLNLSPRLDLLLAFPRLESISMISIDDMCEEDTSYAHVHADGRNYKGWRKIPGVDYEKPPHRGNISAPGRHVCIYCALGRCDDLRERVKGSDRHSALDSSFSTADRERLASLDFYGMLPVKEAYQADPDLHIEEFEGVRVRE